MAKLVLFLFFTVCVVAVQMQSSDELEDEREFDDFLDAISPQIEDQLNYDSRVKIPVKKIWQVAKPILKEVAKEAAKAGGAAIIGG